MVIQKRDIEHTQVRHLNVVLGSQEELIVWWYGALFKNRRVNTLPMAVVWFRNLLADGTLGPIIRKNVGVSELGDLQIGTIWKEGICQKQVKLKERLFDVDYSPANWTCTSQARERLFGRDELFSLSKYPLYHGLNDRSEVLVFKLSGRKRLLIPSLEFFTRCYGRSAEVNRVLCTYDWQDAEPRLHLPHSQAAPPGHWSIKLPHNIYNDDATFLAHVKYDRHAQLTAKRIYADINSQFKQGNGLAFPQIGPWFVGPANLIVEGIELDEDRFLGLRIVGISEPKGPRIWSFRENPGEADEPAPGDAPFSDWPGGRDRHSGERRPMPNITPTDPAGHNGDSVEVRNPTVRIVGPRRDVVPQRLESAKTRPGPPLPRQDSDKHSPGEREGSDGTTGRASIHTESRLETEGAARDVWNTILYLNETMPELIEKVGWYCPAPSSINFTNREPSMVALLPFDEEKKKSMSTSDWKWIYYDQDLSRARGVLISFVKTPSRSAYLFEIERRNGKRTENGITREKEQPFCGLIVSPPADAKPENWIPAILDGIRIEKGIMARVANYCSGYLVDYYRRSSSKGDKIAGHSTVATALSKVNIIIPHPREKTKQRKKKGADQV